MFHHKMRSHQPSDMQNADVTLILACYGRRCRSRRQMVRLHPKTLPDRGHPGSAAQCHERTLRCSNTASLFDHLVGELLELPRHIEAERLGSL
jgi:hypothetical protein